MLNNEKIFYFDDILFNLLKNIKNVKEVNKNHLQKNKYMIE